MDETVPKDANVKMELHVTLCQVNATACQVGWVHHVKYVSFSVVYLSV